VLGLAALVPFYKHTSGALETRGETPARAWLAQDLRAMQQYTDAEAGPDVERWLGQNPPPPLSDPIRRPTRSSA
jgi:hypothetical protein